MDTNDQAVHVHTENVDSLSTSRPRSRGGQPVQTCTENVDKLSRPRVSVRLPAGSLDVDTILANKRAENQEGPFLVAAIRLLNAIQTGDVDYVRKTYPLLAPALGAEQKTRKKRFPPLRSSENLENRSGNLEEGDQEPSEMAKVISEVTVTDLVVNRERIDRLAERLTAGAYTPEKVRAWYSGYWCGEDWRGRKGEPPTLALLAEFIGRSKALAPLPPSTGGIGGELNPYLADPYFQTRAESGDEPVQKTPAARPAVTQGRAANMWLALILQLQVQLTRATFSNYFAHIKLVDVIEGQDAHTFVATVSNAYCREWIDHHARPMMERTLSDLYGRPATIRVEAEERR